MFTGRPAYVWISNQFGNTGIDFTRIGARNNAANRIPFVADPLNQPTTVTGATAGTFNNEIDMIDPDFKYPSILRGNIGGDTQLPGGMVGDVDFVWSKTMDDIKYQNLNLVAALRRDRRRGTAVLRAQSRVDGERRDSAGEHLQGLQLERALRGCAGRSATASSPPAPTPTACRRAIMDGTSDQAASNWGNVYIPADPNNPPLVRSNFDPGHRITLIRCVRHADGRRVQDDGLAVLFARNQVGRTR